MASERGGMFTPAELYHLLDVGAGLAAAESVKVGTKAAFETLKERIIARFGPKAEKALAAIEAAPDAEEAGSALSTAIPAVTAEDAKVLGPAIRSFAEAVRSDPVAKAQVKLDIDAQGNIVIGRIENTRGIDLKARAGRDFRLNHLGLASGSDPGN